MRRLLAGIFLFALSFPVAALAETKGEVEAIGFGSLYRPNCHIPMLVRVQADKSGTYQIRVVQDDLDADQPLFTQIVSLTGSDDGGPGSEQRFWLYFIPQPTDGGLPDVTDGLRAIQSTLKVFLCDENGRQITQLPVTSTIQNIEKAQAGPFSTPRGVKVVLAIAAGGAQPVWRDYQQAIGTIEDVVFVPLRVTDLPEDARGYEMVDAIVWLNAPPPDPALAADEKRYHALREYVRGGGHMVICQPAQRDANDTFRDLLPVDVQAIAPRDNLQPLRRIATAKRPPRGQRDEFDEPRGPLVDDWDLFEGKKFMFARATLKKGAVADEMLAWNADGSDASPYIARIGYGGGCVSWVAHDLSDPAITARAKSGWPFVWDRVLDFKHDTLIIDNRTTDDQKRPYQAGATMDVGFALLKGMELKSKSQLLVTIAVVFFIAYWIVAGPGVYLYLVTKSRPQLSWFMFAFSALVATVLTVLIVRLVVRGAPEMSHVTLVRAAPDAPALAISRFGLYIPRDGAQDIVLPEIAPRAVSYLTAYPAHPSHLAGADIEFPAHMQYVVPTRDPTAEEPVKISVPYRSTLKQFQARRVGNAGGAVEGKAVLRETEAGYGLEGTLVNATGYRLKNVYLVYYQPPASELRREGETEGDDFIYYLSAWEKSQSINLATEFDRSTKFIGLPRDAGNLTGYPEQGNKLRGRVGRAGQEEGWSRFWYAGLKNNGFGNQQLDDLDKPVSKAYPMMSIYGRLPPMRNMSSTGQTDRVEILRRGGRNLDCSAAIAAGRLVVLAEADGKAPLPFPLEVEGDKVEGSGTLLFQSILPMERIDLPPTTQPSATQPDGAGGATVATTGPATTAPAVSATLADEPPTPKPPVFDPVTYTGNMSELTPDQRAQVFQYRRDQQIKARQQRLQQQQQQRQKQQSGQSGQR